MAFGDGYKPIESNKLEVGEYFARIDKTTYEQTKNGTPYLAVYVSIKGIKNARPNVLTFYDRPYVDIKAQEKWDEQMTEFFDAFHLQRGNMDINSWLGATGWVRCVPQKAHPEYKVLYPLKKVPKPTDQKANAPQAQAPQAQGQMANGTSQPQAPSQAQAQKAQAYDEWGEPPAPINDEEIPF